MLKTKICFKCKKRKVISSFYRHPAMPDHHLNKCKGCTKKDIRDARRNPKYRQKILEYDKYRNNLGERKIKKKLRDKKRRLLFPGKARAVTAVNNAVRSGKLKKLPCKKCGNLKVEGHHPDYRKKLDVIWLCNYHHRQVHGRTI